ncbi:MAG: sigma-70 family RNA polymerase sigma factor, partial [Synechococcales bacterium]|nr:sigma-70 family RNA polymerase sigma factor [Synechococcales bacterium]
GKFRQGTVSQFYRWAATVARYAVIDLVRRERRQHCWSLDHPLPGHDLPLMEVIASEGQPLDMLEQTELLQRAIAAIADLDRRYPDRGYWQIWQGRVRGQTQADIARALGVSQGSISKRWKEMIAGVAEFLNLLTSPDCPLGATALKPEQIRQRSPLRW